jgi:protein SCO1/2
MNLFPRTKRVAAAWAALVLCCLAGYPARVRGETASSLPDDTLTRIRFDQRLNVQVSRDLPFRDETGKVVKLGDCFGQKPVILVLGYYSCPMLCNLVLNGLVETLLELKGDVGSRFTVIDVSIDPSEGPELAATKKRTYLKRYGRRGADAGWHFLTGEEPAIKKLAAEVGFGYAYDAGIKQYAHPSGFIVLTPQGKVARYFFGINFVAKELSATLTDAGVEKTGSVVEQLLLLCFHYNPLQGKYGGVVMGIFRVSGLATVLGLVWVVTRARQRRERPAEGAMARTRAPEPAARAASSRAKEEGA